MNGESPKKVTKNVAHFFPKMEEGEVALYHAAVQHTLTGLRKRGIQGRASTKKQEGFFRQIKTTKIKKLMEKEEKGKNST